jgi:hypothetical protein
MKCFAISILRDAFLNRCSFATIGANYLTGTVPLLPSSIALCDMSESVHSLVYVVFLVCLAVSKFLQSPRACVCVW